MSHLVAIPHLGAGHGVGLGVAPLVELDAGVVGTVDAGDLSSRAGLASSRGLDVQLEALDVELGLATIAIALVDLFLAYALHEVLTREPREGRCAQHGRGTLQQGCLGLVSMRPIRSSVMRVLTLLDGPLEPVLVPVGPGSVDAGRAGVGETALHDLDPVTAAIVVGNLARRLGDVDKARTRVLDLLVVEDLEADLVTSLDSVGSSATSLGALVAPKVRGVDNVVGDDRVVRVAVLASVCVLATNDLVVDGENVENVVGVDRQGRCKQREESTSLHVGGEKSEMNICSKEVNVVKERMESWNR